MDELNNIYLRKMSSNDISLVKEWLNKAYIKKWFGDPQEWLNEIKNDDGRYSWIVHHIVEYNQVPIGFCQYYDIGKTGVGYAWDNEPCGTYGIDYLIGDEQLLGKGIGNKLIKELNKLVIDNEKPVQLIADPIKENIASIRVLVNNGYEFDKVTGLYKLIVKNQLE
ncbi:N-acetyltransferase [Paenibacillus apis]|uniref:N-acetyltransferase n=2 Tax=Paenibacillus apis TaxID=1792174 RepID=A0A920CIF7_9BACL|nr:N-acetyltransferase [Paenibacillus apis]